MDRSESGSIVLVRWLLKVWLHTIPATKRLASEVHRPVTPAEGSCSCQRRRAEQNHNGNQITSGSEAVKTRLELMSTVKDENKEIKKQKRDTRDEIFAFISPFCTFCKVLLQRFNETIPSVAPQTYLMCYRHCCWRCICTSHTQAHKQTHSVFTKKHVWNQWGRRPGSCCQ